MVDKFIKRRLGRLLSIKGRNLIVSRLTERQEQNGLTRGTTAARRVFHGQLEGMPHVDNAAT